MLFSWHDVETIMKNEHDTWPTGWKNVSVYSDSIVILYNGKEFSENSSNEYLRNVFKKNYIAERQAVQIDLTGNCLEVYYEEDDNDFDYNSKAEYAPLFKNMEGSNNKAIPESDELPGAKILAFHSFKGGVGRTLSLVSLLRECTQLYPEKKFLVVDADVEASGLAWMTQDIIGAPQISYLDILDVLHYERVSESIIDKLSDMMRRTTIRIETDEAYHEQYFLPVYREMRQVMESSSKPVNILDINENKYIITETISRVAKKMDIDLVLVDLRAGVTELSAPFLFDPRVKKFFVTSTSMQSTYGIKTILSSVYQKTNYDLMNSKMLLTMIPRDMKRAEIDRIEDDLLEEIERNMENANDEGETFLRENYVKEFVFEDRFVHIKDLNMLCSILRGSKLSSTMKPIAEELFTNV